MRWRTGSSSQSWAGCSEPGEAPPNFTLDHFDGSAMGSISLPGSVVVLNVVNSVDTPVCDIQTRRVDDLFPGARVLTVSMDLPFAPARWTTAAGVTPAAVSSHRSEAFGRRYGLLIKEWRALQRSVFVIDGAGRRSSGTSTARDGPDQAERPLAGQLGSPPGIRRRAGSGTPSPFAATVGPPGNQPGRCCSKSTKCHAPCPWSGHGPSAGRCPGEEDDHR